MVDDLPFGPSSTVADVGAGTGLFTRLVARKAGKVYALEPNAAMADQGRSDSREFANVEWCSGTGEATGLEAASIDGLTCAQAFHWLDRARAAAEWRRILKPGAPVVLVWNERDEGSPLQDEYEALLNRWCPEYPKVNHRNLSPEVIEGFFSVRPATKVYRNDQRFDLAGFRGRLRSASYCPAPGQPGHDQGRQGVSRAGHSLTHPSMPHGPRATGGPVEPGDPGLLRVGEGGRREDHLRGSQVAQGPQPPRKLVGRGDPRRVLAQQQGRLGEVGGEDVGPRRQRPKGRHVVFAKQPVPTAVVPQDGVDEHQAALGLHRVGHALEQGELVPVAHKPEGHGGPLEAQGLEVGPGLLDEGRLGFEDVARVGAVGGEEGRGQAAGLEPGGLDQGRGRGQGHPAPGGEVADQEDGGLGTVKGHGPLYQIPDIWSAPR